MRIRTAAVVCTAGLTASAALADNWLMHLTVDNQFDAYFGTSMATNFLAGSGNAWSTTYTFTANNRLPTDYLYIATSSDQSAAQGFIGDFTNITAGASIVTGTTVWQVFAAGAHQQTNPFWPNAWPAGQQPSQSQVDNAIAFATMNNLWQAPDTAPAGAVNGVAPWGFRNGIDPTARWIWHRKAGGPVDPLHGGYNHDEFLIFRVVGIAPAPGALGLLVPGIALIGRRRR